MTAVLDLLVFVLMLCVLVVVHEAGHTLVARLCGARVLEFFVGMPWGPQVSRVSKRTGIRYGATFALFGGYTRIAGMVAVDHPRAATALALVNARGRLEPAELAQVLGTPDDTTEAYSLLEGLAEWGSVERVWPEGGHRRSDLPLAYATVARDADGLTLCDRGHDFDRPGATCAGEPFCPKLGPDAFFEAERKRTYQGFSFVKKAATLAAGVVSNLLFALVALTLFLTLHGVAAPSLELADVGEGSPAAQAGIEAGDRIVAIDGTPVATSDGLTSALAAARERGGSFQVAYERAGERIETACTFDDEGLMGVYLGWGYQTLSMGDAVAFSASYIGEVGRQVAGLIIPTRTAEVLENSAGVVGIAAMTSQAVYGGMWNILLLTAVLSISLGWLNLLPIPPLDGGKLLVEVIAAVRRKPVSAAAQGAASLAGMLLFAALFVYMIVQDLARLAGM